MTIVHIHQPKGYYIGQIRGYGCRRWKTVTGYCKSSKAAMIGAVHALRPNDHRARVLFCADWYEPVIVMECNK